MLDVPGLIDLSYFVDFGNLSEAAEKAEGSELISFNRANHPATVPRVNGYSIQN